MSIKNAMKVLVPAGITAVLYFGGAWWHPDVHRRGIVVSESYSGPKLEDKVHQGFLESFHYQGLGNSEYVLTVNSGGELYSINVLDGATSKETLNGVVEVGTEISFKVGYEKKTRSFGSKYWNTFYKRTDSLHTSDIIMHNNEE